MCARETWLLLISSRKWYMAYQKHCCQWPWVIFKVISSILFENNGTAGSFLTTFWTLLFFGFFVARNMFHTERNGSKLLTALDVWLVYCIWLSSLQTWWDFYKVSLLAVIYTIIYLQQFSKDTKLCILVLALENRRNCVNVLFPLVHWHLMGWHVVHPSPKRLCHLSWKFLFLNWWRKSS